MTEISDKVSCFDCFTCCNKREYRHCLFII